jgi:hypothetical protein
MNKKITPIGMKLLKALIREEIGRNLRTMNNDPYSFEDYPGIDIQIYPAELGVEYHLKITCEFDDSLSKALQVFSTEEEARSAAKRQADDIRNHAFGQNIEL